PAARAGKLLGLRPVGVAPGRGVLVVVMVMMVVAMTVVMVMVVVVMAVVMTTIMRVIMMRMIMSVMMMIVVVIVVLVIVMLVVMRRRHRRADRVQRPTHAARGADKAFALDPDQPHADQRDQCVAHKLDHPLGAAHLARGGVEQGRRDADDGDRND